MDKDKILKYIEPILKAVYTKKDKNLKLKNKIEVESKYVIEDIEKFSETLDNDGFGLKLETIQEDKYLNNNVLRKKGEVVRVRRGYDKTGKFIEGELKWEGPRGIILDRPVKEVKIASKEYVNTSEELLKDKLKIKELVIFIKHRFYYIKETDQGRLEVELDLFEDATNPKKIKGKVYAQVALEVPEEDRKKAIKIVKKVAKKLDLNREDNRNYIEIVEMG